MVFEIAAFGEQPGAFIASALAAPLRRRCDRARPRDARDGVLGAVVGAHGARRRVPRVPAVQQAPPHRHELLQHLLPEARAARRAAGDGPRGGGRDVRAADARRPRLERPPRRLHLHRVRPLPAGLPGLEHGQATQPEALHHGHPGHVGRGRARPPAHPELALGGVVRPDRFDRPEGDARADRRQRDPVRRRLGLRHVRRVRRGLPGADRARRQDRRAAAEPRPRGLALPGGAQRRVPEHGGRREPVGPAADDPDRLDEGPAVRRPDRRRAGRGRSPRRARGPVLGRLRGGVRRAQPEGRAGLRDVPQRGRDPVRDPRARRSRAPATRRGAWATTTCTRCSRPGTSRR